MASVLAIGFAAPAAAQPAAGARHHVFQPATQGPEELAGAVVRAQAVVESKITTGRPYTAEATTEFVQVLGDGNKISRKTTVRIYRDSEGRTRREELDADGTPRSISIYDPVSHLSYVLNPATRIAQKSAVRVVYPAAMPAMVEKVTAEREAGARVAGKIALVAPAGAPGQAASEEVHKRHAEVVAHAGGGGALHPRPATVSGAGAPRTEVTSESLEPKLHDGLPAEGDRRTVVIPAGAVGNQQPITVVSEQWFSPDLDIFVLTKHSDPRTGETTYSVSNIVRGEPSAGLFDVPSDYTIKESSYMRQPAMR
jgi:hypothetical protein